MSNIIRIGLATVAMGAAIVTAAPAQADAGELVRWAANNGYRGTVQVIVARGSLVCADLALGYNGEQAAYDLWLNTGIEAMSDARAFVIASVENLCPQYDHRGEATSYRPAGAVGGVMA